MIHNATGVIWREWEKNGRYGKMYSFKLDGQDNFYSMGNDSLESQDLAEGDTVEFEYTENAKGFNIVDKKSLKKVEAKPEEGAPEDAPAKGSKARESFDRSVQKDMAYNLRAATGMAQDFVKTCLEQDALELPTKGGKAAKYAAIETFVREKRQEYFRDFWDVTNGADIEAVLEGEE